MTKLENLKMRWEAMDEIASYDNSINTIQAWEEYQEELKLHNSVENERLVSSLKMAKRFHSNGTLDDKTMDKIESLLEESE